MMTLLFSVLFCSLVTINSSNILLIYFLFFMFFFSFFPLYYDPIFMFTYLDMVSFLLTLLSIFIFYLCILAMMHSYKNKIILFFLLKMILFFLMMSFLCSSALSFYFFFECSLIPIFFIILGWGNQPERIQASSYLLFYTLVGSLPLLIIILLNLNTFSSMNFISYYTLTFGSSLMGYLMCIFMILAFLIKLPAYILHIWLPKAHVEAPVGGSMILAGVLLKLGGYGIIRFAPFIPEGLGTLSSFLFCTSMVGMVCVGLSCCRQSDLKSLVAYGSVSHMGMVLCGVVNMSIHGWQGCLLMMFCHGLCSSGLFYLINMFYDRTSSRSIFINKGFISLLPSSCMFMFFLCMSNISAPPTLNFLSELFMMYSMVSYSSFTVVLLPLGLFLSSIFTFYLFSFSQHGRSSISLMSSYSMLSINFHVLFLHLYPLVACVLMFGMFNI